MPWDVVIFFILAAVTVLCAVGVVAVNNPVHSAIFLVLCFFNVAGIFVMMGAEFMAAIQVIVYTGAILVLVLFVLFEPMGMYGRWLKIRTYFSLFPFYRKGMFKRQKSFQKSDRLK